MAAIVQIRPPSLSPTTKFNPSPTTSRVNGITIMWAWRSANRNVKNGNSVMWNDTSEYPVIFSGTQKASKLGSIFSKLGNIRLLCQKSKARNGVPSTTICHKF